MTTDDQHPAPEQDTKHDKRPRGRPRVENPLSPAERQRAHRQRQREAVMTAYGKPAGQPTAAILAALARQLVQLDDPERAADHDTVRYMAAQGITELCKRYGIKPLK